MAEIDIDDVEVDQEAMKFKEDWVEANQYFNGPLDEEAPDPQAIQFAENFVAAAEAEGISKERLETAFGDLPMAMDGELRAYSKRHLASQK